MNGLMPCISFVVIAGVKFLRGTSPDRYGRKFRYHYHYLLNFYHFTTFTLHLSVLSSLFIFACTFMRVVCTSR